MLTLLYDGECELCRRSAARLRRADRRGALELLDLNDPAASARFPQVHWERARALMQAVDERGRVYSGAEAWSRAGDRLPGWRRLAWILRLPVLRALAAVVYAWIARNRYRWHPRVCAGESCHR